MITTAREFAQLDLDNPWVWDLFERFALEKASQRFPHYSASMVMGRVRWETDVMLHDGNPGGYKINNDWIPWYARKFNVMYPQYGGGEFFRERDSNADSGWPGRAAARHARIAAGISI